MARADTRTRVLAAAAELIAERGYVGTTTAAIAERAGVNEVTVFRRFASKEGILRALAGAAAAARAEFPPAGAVVEDDLRATLVNLAVVEIRDAIASGGLVLRLTLEARAVPEVRETMGAIASANLQRMAAFMRAHQDRGQLRADLDPSLLAEIFFSLTSTLVMQRMTLEEPGLPADDEIAALAEQVIGSMWSGVRPERGT